MSRLSRFLNGVIYYLDRLGAHRRATVLTFGFLTCALRLLLLPLLPVPEPAIHDEFSYLLGADTFASGRLTNPPHPLWKFFESIHILSQPTYASKYQPGQALLLALGQRVFGHPFYGVVLSVALMIAALCWMLQVYMPPGWALLGTLCALLTYGAGHYWMESYWGGAVCATGSALLLGSYRRITYQERYRFAWLFGGAMIVLFLTRPYEGGLLTAVALAALIAWARGFDRFRRILITRRVAVPVISVIIAAALADGYYNWRITGGAFTMPYFLYQKQYGAVPAFWILPPLAPKSYRNRQLEAQHAGWEAEAYWKIRRSRLPWELVSRMLKKIVPLFGPLPLVALLFWRDRQMRWLLAAVAVIGSGLLIEVWCFQHYMAPMIVVMFALVFRLLWRLRRMRWRSHGLGGGLVLLSIAALFLTSGIFTALRIKEGRDAMNTRPAVFPWNRAEIADQLRHRGGRHVVILRYSASHSVGDEWVYNAARIDDAPIIWARDRGAEENLRLANYYQGRRIWLLQPDARPPRLERYR